MGLSNLQAEGLKGASKNLGRGNQTTKPKKNTVASLLAQTRRDSEQGLASSHPELTIEPIFRSTPSQVRTCTAKVSPAKPSLITLLQSPVAHGEDEFDQSLGGRRISAYYDSDGALSDLPFQVLTRFYHQAAWESRMSRSRRKSAISRNVATAAAAKIPKRWAARPTS